MEKHSSGQMLVEVLFALAIALLVSFGLIRSIIYSINNSNFAKDQSQATNIANRKMAEYIDGSNNNWGYFATTPSQEVVIDDKFCVKNVFTDISAQLPAGNMEKISVDVFWSEIAGTPNCGSKNYSHSQHFETYVTN